MSPWGGLKILGMGGTGLHEGGQPLDGVGSPPPYLTTLAVGLGGVDRIGNKAKLSVSTINISVICIAIEIIY